MTRPATRFRAGQTIGATQLNRAVDLANALNKSDFGSVARRLAAGSPFRLEIKTLATVAPWGMKCVFIGAAANPAAFEWTVYPPAMFHEASRNFGGTIGNVTYAYTNINERVATGTGTETQYLTPPFIVGEPIQIQLIDNLVYFVPDGRMWAIDPPP